MGLHLGISCRSGREYVDREVTTKGRVRSMPVLREEIRANEVSRRDILTLVLRATQQCGVYLLASQMPALAEDQQVPTIVYHDEMDGFSITVPQGWTMGTGSLGDKKADRFSNAAGMQRVLGWAPTSGNSDTSATSIAVTIKTPGADYTGLGSFGTAQDFGEKLVVAIDRSYMAKGFGRKMDQPIITAKLLSAKETRGRYLIEYETGKTGEPSRHVWTLVCFGENNKGLRRFYTVTASCTEEDLEQLKDDLSNALESFET